MKIADFSAFSGLKLSKFREILFVIGCDY